MSDHDQYLKAFGADVTRHIETVIEAARGETPPVVAGAVRNVCGDGTSGSADHSGARGHNVRLELPAQEAAHRSE